MLTFLRKTHYTLRKHSFNVYIYGVTAQDVIHPVCQTITVSLPCLQHRNYPAQVEFIYTSPKLYNVRTISNTIGTSLCKNIELNLLSSNVSQSFFSSMLSAFFLKYIIFHEKIHISHKNCSLVSVEYYKISHDVRLIATLYLCV